MKQNLNASDHLDMISKGLFFRFYPNTKYIGCCYFLGKNCQNRLLTP